jgi:Na+-transporting NADH:ubiquinone oxidoreductase subunit A
MPIGADLRHFFETVLEPGAHRILDGDLLSGREVTEFPGVDLATQAFTVIPEDPARILLGWTTPAWAQFSLYRTALSRWLRGTRRWALGTNLHGGRRAMVVTGWYDRFQPLNILTDYLIRAVLAHDTEEAVKLGILETDPEDFALAAFACPAKTDLCGIIRQGLDEIEEEGL